MAIWSLSRNALAPIVEIQDDQGNVISPERVDIREAIDSSTMTDLREFGHTQGNSWGNIGYKRLGDARHWWVIAELSGILDPFTELTPGKRLTTTSIESLHLDIFSGV